MHVEVRRCTCSRWVRTRAPALRHINRDARLVDERCPQHGRSHPACRSFFDAPCRSCARRRPGDADNAGRPVYASAMCCDAVSNRRSHLALACVVQTPKAMVTSPDAGRLGRLAAAAWRRGGVPSGRRQVLANVVPAQATTQRPWILRIARARSLEGKPVPTQPAPAGFAPVPPTQHPCMTNAPATCRAPFHPALNRIACPPPGARRSVSVSFAVTFRVSRSNLKRFSPWYVVSFASR